VVIDNSHELRKIISTSNVVNHAIQVDKKLTNSRLRLKICKKKDEDKNNNENKTYKVRKKFAIQPKYLTMHCK